MANSKARRSLSDDYNAIATKSATAHRQPPSRTKKFFRRVGRCLLRCLCVRDDSDSGSVVTRPSGEKSSTSRHRGRNRDSLPHPLESHPVTFETLPEFLRARGVRRDAGNDGRATVDNGDNNDDSNGDKGDNGDNGDANGNAIVNIGSPSDTPREHPTKLSTIESMDESQQASHNGHTSNLGSPAEDQQHSEANGDDQQGNANANANGGQNAEEKSANNFSSRSLRKAEDRAGDMQGSAKSTSDSAADAGQRPFDSSGGFGDRKKTR